MKSQFLKIFVFILGILPLFEASSQESPIFENEEVLEFELRADMSAIFKDRDEDSEYYPAVINHQGLEVPLKVRTRGHFRKMSSNCKYPPLLLNFKKSETPETSIFSNLDKVKLVTPCRDEELVIREYLVYKLYNLVTPFSFRARLVRIVYRDTAENEQIGPYYGVIIEEEEEMAKRNNAESIDKLGLKPQAIKDNYFLQMAVFQFMIGNTDWSIQYLQNMKLILKDGEPLPIAVPYDFDHAGIVRAPYAKPAPELKLASTQDRRYRGDCPEDMSQFSNVFEIFNRLKPQFYALYQENVLLDERYKKQTLKFLDKFFETTGDPKKAERAFTYPCNPMGTGHVVIKGLREIKN